MNMRISSYSLIALIGILFGCEKDDICSGETATTPRLVIECFDAANPNTPKNVNNLVVKAIGLSGTIVFDGVSKIYVPIDTNNDTTQLELIQNGNDTDASNDNIDLLTLNYTRTTVYVSRACGYKMNFLLSTNGAQFTDTTPADSPWISSYTLEKNAITNENEVHVKLYF